MYICENGLSTDLVPNPRNRDCLENEVVDCAIKQELMAFVVDSLASSKASLCLLVIANDAVSDPSYVVLGSTKSITRTRSFQKQDIINGIRTSGIRRLIIPLIIEEESEL
ncbi:predicted protein [Histoplasma capsulatum var. duboisii H88]|uniref:Predicted protein n=1 Tax=Ajellomyces capsulatus (strain H88) TaxID=544711 RepID=F0UB96_AJEC8|nr:predicted protein [Histoplasma capsulatum var. duboisii H88]